MPRQIILRPLAKQDLIEQYVFLEERNDGAADRFLKMTDHTLEELVQMPEMGSLQQFKNPILIGIRKWRIRDFEKHLIFYRPFDNGIDVIRILYATRDIRALFEED